MSKLRANYTRYFVIEGEQNQQKQAIKKADIDILQALENRYK